jgi:hypothetical protein
MVSRTKQGNALRAAFADFVTLIRDIPGVKAAVATDEPAPAMVTFIDHLNDDLLGDIGEAEGNVVRAHLDIVPEFRTIFLRGSSLTDYAIAEGDLVYLRQANGE